MVQEEGNNVKKKKIPAGSVKIQMAGDLLFARSPDRDLSQLFRRYEALLERLANMDREERTLNYKFFLGLILTSHAKKTQDIDERKAIFDLKNDLFFNIANNRNTRRKVGFRYLASKNFRVIKFCEKCVAENTKEERPRHKWKFCEKCDVDRKFYNVLQMSHHFEDGTMSLFLSNDLVHKIPGLKLNQKGKLEGAKEEGRFDKYHYNVRNLDVFDIDSVKAVHAKLLKA
ncbi:hypothetical protein [Pseudobacteriovorax antillogorgiicola]|uniref:Uncharacterized protein n=1 Tax=Pseudobacteriovorax antillogorgiicola TaxID=1513793 RepID=A0A1Y6CUQ1_9BACT|nr:hypothetical protein [Pseudobacteriovorax antillogorgiicola]TCS44384.1 hypothetical protein EDD56_13311 [Pseudobacteriovorax antillogorgiicola]SMF79376.1 hypothetical protein SAMN06296036_13363 [Pseudobacteriovorax antillogorgiicola]